MLHPFRSRNPIRLLPLAIAAFLIAACGAATTIDQSWTSPTAQSQPPMQKVATVFVSHDPGMRRTGEDQMARELTAKGVQAVPAYAVLGDTDMRDLDTVKSTLAAQGYDGVVTMRTVEKEQQLEYAPETFDDFWGVASSGFFEPGYAYTETVVRMETNAYSLRDNQLVWSALTRTVDPASSRQLVDETSKVVASQLTERGLAG